MVLCGAIFTVAWWFIEQHRWFWWSVVGTELILFVVWITTQFNVAINDWFGPFYDMIQNALGKPNSVTASDYYWQVAKFLIIVMPLILLLVINDFFVRHYIFRWRTAMNDYYVAHWPELRKIEGAAQRIQEDTMRFATTMEDLATSMISSVMTLIAFLPILWGFSSFVKEVPIFGQVPQALVIVAVVWSIFGTGVVAIAGVRLPGLNFRNQRVEAAYRKELVIGEDEVERAQPPTLGVLFREVRRNYFRIYWNYIYFNVARYSYLQVGVLVSYVALGPTIVAGGFTLGVMNQILMAFDQVASSFQFLVNSWSTIVEQISIVKRLQAFEATLHHEPLASIEKEPIIVVEGPTS